MFVHCSKVTVVSIRGKINLEHKLNFIFYFSFPTFKASL